MNEVNNNQNNQPITIGQPNNQTIIPPQIQNPQNITPPTASPNVVNEEEELLRAYIGNSYDEIKQKKFNGWAFFFSNFYLLYRKKILWAFLYILAYAILALFLEGAELISSVLVGIFFNKFYIEDTKKQIAIIKNEYPSANIETLKGICAQKGGTSIGLAIGLGIVFELLIVILYIFIIVGSVLADKDLMDELKEMMIFDYDTHVNMKQEFTFEDLPELDNISEYYNYNYTYETDNEYYDYCDIYLHKVTNYNSIDQIIKENAPEEYKSNPINKTINNITWTGYKDVSSIAEDYVYITEKNDNIYVLEYDIFGRNENGPCHIYKENILDYIYIKDEPTNEDIFVDENNNNILLNKLNKFIKIKKIYD